MLPVNSPLKTVNNMKKYLCHHLSLLGKKQNTSILTSGAALLVVYDHSDTPTSIFLVFFFRYKLGLH